MERYPGRISAAQRRGQALGEGSPSTDNPAPAQLWLLQLPASEDARFEAIPLCHSVLILLETDKNPGPKVLIM